jgi:transposase
LHSGSSYKRLEEGTFRLPAVKSIGPGVELRASELAMLLEGIDLKSLRRSARFRPPAAMTSHEE